MTALRLDNPKNRIRDLDYILWPIESERRFDGRMRMTFGLRLHLARRLAPWISNVPTKQLQVFLDEGVGVYLRIDCLGPCGFCRRRIE